jgi:hypothetical protein
MDMLHTLPLPAQKAIQELLEQEEREEEEAKLAVRPGPR